MGKLNEWFRKLLGGSPRRQPNKPQGSGVTEAPSDCSQSEETQLRLTDSVRIREAVPQTAWQERGRYLQVADGTRSRVRPVHLGVDFGTALTKVAVRVAGFVFFIPWDELIGDAGYLLPGRLSSTKNGASVPGTGKCQALRSQQDDEIIGPPTEPVSPPFQFLVELIEHWTGPARPGSLGDIPDPSSR